MIPGTTATRFLDFLFFLLFSEKKRMIDHQIDQLDDTT